MSTERAEVLKRLAADKVIVIAGTGVTVATTKKHPSADWPGLFRALKESSRFQEATTDARKRALRLVDVALEAYSDVDDYLTAGSALQKGWGNDFLTWLKEEYGKVNDTEDIDRSLITALGSLGCPILTTNYDRLIERVLGWPHAVLSNTTQALSILSNQDKRTVLHLHGYFADPDSLVLDTESYRTIVNDTKAQQALRSVMDRSYLFVGCGEGLQDPNFSMLHKTFERFALDPTVRHFRLVLEKDARGQDPNDPIKLVPYGDDFPQLAGYIEALANEARPSTASTGGRDPVRAAPAEPDDVLLKFTNDAVEVLFKGAGGPLEVKGSTRPDWARRETVAELDAELHHWTEAEYGTRLTRAKLLGGHLMMRHGQQLAKALLEVNKRPGSFDQCRLVLEFDDERAEDLPWEYLYSHGEKDLEPDEAFLGRVLGFSIVRRKRYNAQLKVPPRSSDRLHVMLVGCDPGDTLKLAPLQDRMRRLEDDKVLKLYELGEGKTPSPDTVYQTFCAHSTDLARNGERIDVVHVVGEVAEHTKLVLDANNNLSGDELAALLPADVSRPRLLLLHLQDAPARMAGSARSLVQVARSASARVMPNVMALPYRRSDEANLRYVGALYRHLAAGERVDAAIRMAADTYTSESAKAGLPRECCMFPVLYCGEPMIFGRSQSSDASGSRPTPGIGGRPGGDPSRSSRSEAGAAEPAERRGASPSPPTGFR